MAHPPPPPARLDRLRTLVHALDSAFRVPGTSWRFGLDSVVGLVPGAGDLAGALLSAYVVLEAARHGVRGPTLLRMLANVGLDTLVGAVPLLGDVFDAGWKANRRNLRLLEDHLASPGRARRASLGWLVVVAAGVVLVVVGLGVGAVWILAALLRSLGLG